MTATVYKIYAEDELLYVGRTVSFVARMQGHFQADWWPKVTTIRLEQFRSANEAISREIELIYKERPGFNLMVAEPRLITTTRLEEARKEHGFSREEVAERAGVTARTILRLERGTAKNPRFTTVQALTELFGESWRSLRQVVEREEDAA